MTSACSSGPLLAEVKNLWAILGPTNTGKTHLAIARMLGHKSGMIGLPLRLLAREVYDRASAQAGADKVALITGEEKIIPLKPHYYVCTVEAMPDDIAVDFLAIDEIQLAADFERGHIFSSRILHRRGRLETLLLGADTMRGILKTLLPGISIETRPRFSQLRYAGLKKITRLPPRSAIVSFSSQNVYEIAELVRRQRGGAAVVMGALSPRTRNAQVALYQSGDVDFLVASDAIGMGLNMDVDHVAFASLRKFDGADHRRLSPAELAQIAGRAGRHMNDGSFGVTAQAPALENEIVAQIENHEFEPVRMLQWRNTDLDFSSIACLLESLNVRAPRRGLVRTMPAVDMTGLEGLARHPDIADFCATGARVKLLWEVCQIPDFRKNTGGDHGGLLEKLFLFLMANEGKIPQDWFARKIGETDRIEGDIETLAMGIAHVRTWTFVANRAGWLEDPVHWQEKTRAVEDRLSDALHEKLIQRFVDRRTAVLMKRLREKEDLMAAVNEEGEVLVEGEFVGRLQGFQFVPDTQTQDAQGKTLKAAAIKALAGEIAARATRLANSVDEAFALQDDARLSWHGAPVARLTAGDSALAPRVEVIADEHLSGAARGHVRDRLERWLKDHIAAQLDALVTLHGAEDLTGMARGVGFQLVEQMGVLARDKVAAEVKSLDQEARKQLRSYGVRFGFYSIFLPAILKPAAAKLKLMLWAIQQPDYDGAGLAGLPEAPAAGLTTAAANRAAARGFYDALGYRWCGRRVVRIDMLERLGDLIRPLIYWKPEKGKEGPEADRPAGSYPGGGFMVQDEMVALMGCSGEDFISILTSIGYRKVGTRKVVVAAQTQNATADTKPPVADIGNAAGSALQAGAASATSAETAAPETTETQGETQGETQIGDGDGDGMVEIIIWREKGKADAQRGPHAKSKTKTKGTGDWNGGGRNGGGQKASTKPGAKPAGKSDFRPGKKETEMDPDSPFAALKALKVVRAQEKGK